jgi:hypothetical protein
MSAPYPSTYAGWQAAAWTLLEPLVPLMSEGAAQLPLTGPPSDHDLNADRLEAFARPCLLAAFWLQAAPGGEGEGHKAAIARWFRRALVLGTDPTQPQYWGPNASYHQNGVEMGLLVIALKVAAAWLWDPLTAEEQVQVGRWMASNRGTGHHWNNHLFFGIIALEFLRDLGMDQPSDAAAVEAWFAEMERMYRDGGWFMDGMNQSYDHYNAYAFHFYGPLWAWLYGARQPARAARWLEWTQLFLDSYQHFFAASGEHPAFGRSIAYRFNASAPFAAAALGGALSIPAGRARRLMSRNLNFFLSKPLGQAEGALSLGWHDPFPELAEKYSCAGSPYWAVKSFVCLVLPPDHRFWTEPEDLLVAERGDYAVPIPQAGLVVRATGGEVEIINAGSEISPVNKEKFGPWKWGKLAYRTGVGFTISHSNDDYSPDMGLTVKGGRLGRRYGRHFTTPFLLSADRCAAVYSLGDKYEQINTVVETRVWWKAGWLLQCHHYDNYQPMAVCLGGYALSATSADAFVVDIQAQCSAAWVGERGTVLQALCTDVCYGWDARLDTTRPRAHVQAAWHRTPLLERAPHSGSGWIAGLCWAGANRREAAPWTVVAASAGDWQLSHPVLGMWQIHDPYLPALFSHFPSL